MNRRVEQQAPGAAGWLAALGVWVLTRALMAVLWVRRETFIDHDVRYYYWQLTNRPPAEILVEYPTPIPVLLDVLRFIVGAAGGEAGFLLAFVMVMFLIDAATTIWLWIDVNRTSAVYWAAFTFAVGSLIWFRIDLLPAVAALAGLIWFTRHPIASGVAVALGAATKLWPAMLIGPMLASDRNGQRRALGFGVAGVALGLASLFWFGWQRSISPLTWQSDRGLQIESIAATWPMLRHAFERPDQYYTELSQYNAWEIYGPGVEGWQQLTDWLLVGTVLLAIVLSWLIAFNGVGLPGRRLRPDDSPGAIDRRTHAVVLAQLALICAFIVANKTFSPQYMIWLAAPLAALVALRLPTVLQRQAWWLAGLGLACAVLTHLVFPLNYEGLIGQHGEPADTLLLAGRNLLMVAFTVYAIVAAVRAALQVGRPD